MQCSVLDCHELDAGRKCKKRAERRRKLERESTLSRDSLIASVGGEDKCNRASSASIMPNGVHGCNRPKEKQNAIQPGLIFLRKMCTVR